MYAKAFPEDQAASNIAIVLHRSANEASHLKRDLAFIENVLEPELRKIAEEEGGLTALPPPAPLPVREAWLVVHRDLKDVPRVRALVDHLVAVFEAERAHLE